MARVDLRKSSGFPIFYDNGELFFQDMDYESVETYSIDRMRPQLLNAEVTCPEIFCKKYLALDHQGIYKDKGLQINVYLVMPNLAGIEYVKTYANMLDKNTRLIEIVQGGGAMVIQDFSESLEGDIIISTLKKDQKVIVPPKYDFSISNTKSTPLIFLEFHKYGVKTTDTLDEINGMSYYVIRKNAKQEVVRNPLYRLASKGRKINWDKILLDKSITSKTPLIKQILRKYEKFDWIFTQAPFPL